MCRSDLVNEALEKKKLEEAISEPSLEEPSLPDTTNTPPIDLDLVSNLEKLTITSPTLLTMVSSAVAGTELSQLLLMLRSVLLSGWQQMILSGEGGRPA